MKREEVGRCEASNLELSSEYVYKRQTVAVSGSRIVVVDVTPFSCEPREGVMQLDGRRAVVVQAYPSSRQLWFQWFLRCWLEG